MSWTLEAQPTKGQITANPKILFGVRFNEATRIL
jgi:hypothetical protein